MTDLEITRLCAEAMELKQHLYPLADLYKEATNISALCSSNYFDYPDEGLFYDPINDDAQAMALVKKFGLSICAPSPHDKDWQALKVWTGDSTTPSAFSQDLNRAICECVAKTQQARKRK